jgi:hypothetical protein
VTAAGNVFLDWAFPYPSPYPADMSTPNTARVTMRGELTRPMLESLTAYLMRLALPDVDWDSDAWDEGEHADLGRAVRWLVVEGEPG